MRAIVCEAWGSPANLKVTDVPEPEPGPGEVRLKIAATGLGYVDALTVAGLYQIKPPLPFIPGNEVSGTVDAAGSDVEGLVAGQRVLAMPPRGGLAEKVCLPAGSCVPIPDTLSFDAAAGFLVNYCTAWHGLIDCGRLQPGETVLVLGASGGVGVAAIDVATAQGATVIAAASTADKRDACLALGASTTIDYSRDDWRDALKAVLGDRPLDLVYDPVGGDFSEPAFRSLSPGGRFLVVGFAAGSIARIPLNLPLLKRTSIIGVNWGAHVGANPPESRRVVSALMDWIQQGKLHPKAGETFPLEQAGQAMMKMLNREAIGKVVITMG